MKSQSKSMNTRQLILDLKKQAGMTLMEIIAALAIIAAVVVGALSLFNSASSSNQAVTMLKDLIAVRSAVQQLYLGQGGYAAAAAGAIHLQLFNSKKYPSDLTYIDPANGFRTPWGGRLSILPVADAAGGGNFPRFSITLTAVPPEICSQLVTNASNGWQDVSIGGAVLASATAAPLFPVSPATANGACGGGAGVDVIWTTPN